jgi:RNA polymerase sigma-70 factor (ECF subfamily)
MEEAFSLSSLVPAILPGLVDIDRTPVSERLDGKGDDGLAFAVYPAPEPPCRSATAPHNPRADRRFVVADASDEMLLKHVAEGDKAAMHIMFARHRKRVSRFIQGIVRNPAIVDDIVSQVFLDVWRSASRFENRSRVSTWLLSIARFKAAVSLRERRHETIDSCDMLGIADDADTPEAALDRKEASGMLKACIARLSPAHREIIDLFYYREMSVSEMSEIVGIPHATVKSRIFYARKKLARILVSAGFDAAAIQAQLRETSQPRRCSGLRPALRGSPAI